MPEASQGVRKNFRELSKSEKREKEKYVLFDGGRTDLETAIRRLSESESAESG